MRSKLFLFAFFAFFAVISRLAAQNPSLPSLPVNRIAPALGQTNILFDGGLQFSNDTLKANFITYLGLTGGGGSGSGTVTSVAMTVPSGLSISGTPITGSGTLALTTTLSGMIKGTGSGFTAGTAGTDYLAPAAIGTTVQAYSASTTVLGNTTTGTGSIVRATSPSLSGVTLTGSTTTGTLNSITLTGGAANAVTYNPSTFFTASPSQTDFSLANTVYPTAAPLFDSSSDLCDSYGNAVLVPRSLDSSSSLYLFGALYDNASTAGTAGQVLTSVVIGGLPYTAWATLSGSGTVTSVAMTVPTGLSISGSPITGSGTLAITTSLSGIIKGTGSAFSAATAGTDYLTPSGNGSALTGLTKSQVSLGSVENTALSTWAGTSNITTVGTVSTGTWHATAVADTYIASAATWNAKQAALTAGVDYLAPGGSGASLAGITSAQIAQAINVQTGTTYTAVSGDNGAIVHFTNSGSITVTLPNNLAAGWTCTFVQEGAGQVTFSGASGATVNNRQSQLKIAGQYGSVSASVYTDSGTNAIYVLWGDTAP